jgi:two-component system CheB/CheR fusion protein
MEADPVRLDQVVWNLVSNAMKFTPKGGHIEVKLVTDAHTIELDVIDDGVGMTGDLLGRVFNMFEEASTRPNRQAGGLGIGLALVRQLVELQDGEVTAHSDGPGKGTRMCVRWPLKPCRDTESTPAAPGQELAGRRIVLVDDSAAVLEPFGELLTMEGAEVRMFDNGAAALEYARTNAIDVLFSDIGMPGMDGYELIRAIRELPQHVGLLAIALTGFGRAQDGERAREAGFNAHIGKPIMMKNLMDSLRQLDRQAAAS